MSIWIVGLAVVLLVGVYAGPASSSCSDPTTACMFECRMTHDTEYVCLDKCDIKSACAPSFDFTGCHDKCTMRCQAAQAKLSAKKGCVCNQSDPQQQCP
jgi:hypothetical protein